MADRNSARTFNAIFKKLATMDTKIDRFEFAKWLWKLQKSKDFHPCQMECDDALIDLGLASRLNGEMYYPD